MRTATASAFVLAATSLVSACYPMPRLAPVWPSPEPVSNYTVGETRRAIPGAVMVDRTDGSQLLPGFVLTRAIGVLGTSEQPPDAGSHWVARFEYQGACAAGRYVVTNPYFYEERVGIVISSDGTIECPRPVVQLVGGNRGRTWPLDEPVPVTVFDPVPYVAGFSQDAVRWQLVYDGRTGNKVRLRYREFRDGAFDDNAEPVHEQDLTYDLGKTRRIVFRKTEIEILSATSRDVSYRVVREESRATQMPRWSESRSDDAPVERRTYEERTYQQRTVEEPGHPRPRGPGDYQDDDSRTY